MEEIRFKPGDEPEVLVCTSHECKVHIIECKGVLSVNPAAGELDPPAEIRNPRLHWSVPSSAG